MELKLFKRGVEKPLKKPINFPVLVEGVITGSIVWFEVDQSPLLNGCYLFSSNNLKETLDWCYDNLNIDLMYY